MRLLQEAIEFNAAEINDMELQDKDVLVVIGDPKSGKTSILSALKDRPRHQPPQAESTQFGIIRPQKAIEPFQYRDEFCGLDQYSCIEFPGVFGSFKCTEIDLALQLSLQKVLTQAKTARVLLLLSAKYFLPDNLSKLSHIKERLSGMFQEPHKHIVIGITQSKELQNHEETMYIPDDIYQLLLADYMVLIAEPEDTEGLQEVILALTTS